MNDNFSKVKKLTQPCVLIAIIMFSFCRLEASTWHTRTEDTSKEEIKQIVLNAVNEKLKENNNRPIHFSDIPALEEGWEAEKRQDNKEWLNKYNELHRKWLDRFNKLSTARGESEGKSLIESNISAIDKNIQALKRQREREEQIFDQDLNEIRESVIVWGKANFGTGETKDLTLAQIKDRIKIFSGKSAVKYIKGKTINSLRVSEKNSIVMDKIESNVDGHYKITSVFPEELSRIDHENEDWRYLVQKIEVCPFAKDSNNKLKKAELTTFVKGGFLRNVSEIEAFLANEQLKNPNSKKWLEEELKNLTLENSEIAKKILSTETMFKKREEEINKDINRLTEQKNKLVEQLKKITAEESLRYLAQEFREVSNEYKGHYSQRIILGSRKIFDTPKSTQNVRDVFAAMVSEALNSYKLDEGDYTQYVLRENKHITNYIEKIADWTLKEKAFRILYLSRRNIGSQSQYIAYLQFKTRLTAQSEHETCDEHAGTIQVGDTINATLAESSEFGVFSGRVKTLDGYVDGLWLEHHGFNGIKVKIKLNNLSQRWEMYHIDGSPVKDFQYVVSIGNLGGAQTKDIFKVYVVAFSKDSSSYCILAHPNVEAVPVVDGMREINLNIIIKNLIKDGAIRLLGSPPFNLQDETINKLFAPDSNKKVGTQ